ncbi:UNVERIFIED_CONTAM: hypothetical protein Sradi_2978700 [Sesamum radiatum]|uniref:Uncharacterized protein n=1 Tax=Sesamum radiatum TaxID=300843 RepID=A0AAW2S0A3_SESRA
MNTRSRARNGNGAEGTSTGSPSMFPKERSSSPLALEEKRRTRDPRSGRSKSELTLPL